MPCSTPVDWSSGVEAVLARQVLGVDEEGAGGEHVAAHDRLGPLAVTVGQGVAQLAVVVLAAGEGVVGVLVEGPHDQGHVHHAGDHRGESRAGRDPEQLGVEGAVVGGEGVEVAGTARGDGPLHAGAQPPQPGHVLRGRPGGGAAGAEALQQCTQLEGLLEVVGGPAADPGPTVRQVLDEALRAQALQGLADRGAADPELLGQGVLRQPGAGGADTAEDAGTQGGVGAICGGHHSPSGWKTMLYAIRGLVQDLLEDPGFDLVNCTQSIAPRDRPTDGRGLVRSGSRSPTGPSQRARGSRILLD
jgi:hypothetical protein